MQQQWRPPGEKGSPSCCLFFLSSILRPAQWPLVAFRSMWTQICFAVFFALPAPGNSLYVRWEEAVQSRASECLCAVSCWFVGLRSGKTWSKVHSFVLFFGAMVTGKHVDEATRRNGVGGLPCKWGIWLLESSVFIYHLPSSLFRVCHIGSVWNGYVGERSSITAS